MRCNKDWDQYHPNSDDQNHQTMDEFKRTSKSSMQLWMNLIHQYHPNSTSDDQNHPTVDEFNIIHIRIFICGPFHPYLDVF